MLNLALFSSILATASYALATGNGTSPTTTNAAYTSSLLSQLWSGITVSTAAVSTTVSPTPLSTTELIPPPNLPVLDSDYRLPSGFMWGMAGAAFQVEGAVKADNRGPTIWDWASHKVPGFIVDNYTADVSDNHYYLYKQDAQRLKALGMTHFSLTIGWSRIFPFGNGTVNQVGLQHYIDEIDYLVELGIEPIVTLYHWDLPQTLQNWYGGWLDERIVHDFARYARVVFNALAPKVKTWITLNEPEVFCSDYQSWPSQVPDSVFPTFGYGFQELKYYCGHHALLAHAAAVEIYRKEIVPKYGQGKISFKSSWAYGKPLTISTADQQAAQRNMDFGAGWFDNPVYLDGDYPQSMKDTLGTALPTFTEGQKKKILGSADFLAWDGYSGSYVSAPPGGLSACVNDTSNSLWPACVSSYSELPGGWAVGATAAVGSDTWLFNTPDLFREGVKWAWDYYNLTEFVVTEFGFSVYEENGMPLERARYDLERVDYFVGYLNSILKLVNEDKINISGAISWGFLDNFEWNEGLGTRFGLQYVNYTDESRYFKKSAFYFKDFFQTYVAN